MVSLEWVANKIMEGKYEMTKTELLFREFRRNEAISYAEFKAAGWEVEDYLEYINICEQIRAFCICEDSLSSFPGFTEEAFQKLTSKLSDFLAKFFEQPLEINFQSWALSEGAYAHYCIRPQNKEELYASKILSSSEGVRFSIEKIINTMLTHDMGQIFGDNPDEIKTEELKEEIQKMRKILTQNTPPELPDFGSPYPVLQEWASDYDNYCYIENNYEDIIEILEEAIEDRIEFNVRKHILNVYIKPPICTRNHRVKSVTANIPYMDGSTVPINIHYCLDCKNFFITNAEYEQYLKEYKFLPVRFYKVEGEIKYNGYGVQREKSDLNLCGYTVGQKENLSAQERQSLLAHLMDNGVFYKYEIINHLGKLININGQLPNNGPAREKWERDRLFVMNYKLSEQDEVNIDKIESASKYLKRVP